MLIQIRLDPVQPLRLCLQHQVLTFEGEPLLVYLARLQLIHLVPLESDFEVVNVVVLSECALPPFAEHDFTLLLHLELVAQLLDADFVDVGVVVEITLELFATIHYIKFCLLCKRANYLMIFNNC